MVQPMKLLTSGWPSMKSVHDGFQSNSKNCTKRNVWRSAKGFWKAVLLKVTISWRESSRKRKHGSKIMNRRVNAREWNGNMLICLTKERSKHIRLQESLCLQFLGLTKATAGTLSREGSTVHSARYIETLYDKLKPAIRRLL